MKKTRLARLQCNDSLVQQCLDGRREVGLVVKLSNGDCHQRGDGDVADSPWAFRDCSTDVGPILGNLGKTGPITREFSGPTAQNRVRRRRLLLAMPETLRCPVDLQVQPDFLAIVSAFLGIFLLCSLHDRFHVGFFHLFAYFPVNDKTAIAVQNAAHVVKGAGQIQVRDVDVPMSMRSKRLCESFTLLRRSRMVGIAVDAEGPTNSIVSPTIMMVRFASGLAPVPSINVPPVMATRFTLSSAAETGSKNSTDIIRIPENTLV